MHTAIPEKEFVPSDWSQYALCYDSLLHLTPYVTMLHEVVDSVLSFSHTTILDASCGTANFEMALFERCGALAPHVTGVDMSEHMLERARNKCAHVPQFSFKKADLNTRLPFPDGTFSHVVSLNTLYAVQSPEATLQEFHRVLTPTGHLTLVTPKYGYENGLILKKHCGSEKPDAYWAHVHDSHERGERLLREAITAQSVIADMILVGEFNAYIARTSMFHFFTHPALQELLDATGFRTVRSSFTYAEQDFFITAQKGGAL